MPGFYTKRQSGSRPAGRFFLTPYSTHTLRATPIPTKFLFSLLAAPAVRAGGLLVWQPVIQTAHNKQKSPHPCGTFLIPIGLVLNLSSVTSASQDGISFYWPVLPHPRTGSLTGRAAFFVTLASLKWHTDKVTLARSSLERFPLQFQTPSSLDFSLILPEQGQRRHRRCRKVP